MENSEILGFQFEPTRALQPESSLDESWETRSTDSEPASVDTLCIYLDCSQMPATKECLCCHELDACDYFKLKRFVNLFTHNFANFLYQTNQ